MEINDFRDNGRMYLSELDPGDVFEYENNFYLVTKDREDKTVTVVNLITGEVLQADGRKGVNYIEKVELILKD